MNVLKFRMPENVNKKSDIIISHNDTGNAISKYSNNIWNFSNNITRNLRSSLNLNFNKVFSNGELLSKNPLLLETFKDIIYKLSISGIKYGTLQHHFNDIFIFLNYIYVDLKIEDIRLLKESDVDTYVDYLISKKMAYNTIRSKLFIVKNSFFKFRNDLDYYISFEPFKNINITKKVKNNGNVLKHQQTEIIPDTIWKQIIQASYNYIKLYNQNISMENYILTRYKHALTVKNNNFRSYYKSFKLSGMPYQNRKEHLIFIRKVQVSCAIIIQAFTGMRVSELHSLTKDSIVYESVKIESENFDIIKIKGRTYKYVDKDNFGKENGREVFWICPPIVEEAIQTLNDINRGTIHYLSINGIDTIQSSIFLLFQSFSEKINCDVDLYYKRFLEEHNIDLNFKLTSHSFRRTFARFLARSIIEIPIEVIKEQFKHYSKHITFYYMREDEKADIEFAELINEYMNNEDKNDSKYLFSEIKSKIDNSILTAKNIDELIEYVDGRKLNLVNEFMASINEKPEILSPISCLTCNGNVIIPKLHLPYWKELLCLYEEMIELEPNSIWHKQEREMIKKVVIELENNNVYITGDIK